MVGYGADDSSKRTDEPKNPLRLVFPQVDCCVNVVAMKRPAILPRPMKEPRIPWYLLRSFSVTTSDTMIIARAVTPPLATPTRPRKTKSMIAFWGKPDSSSLAASRTSVERMAFLPTRYILVQHHENNCNGSHRTDLTSVHRALRG